MDTAREHTISRIICVLNEQESIREGTDLRVMAEHIYNCVCTDGYRVVHERSRDH